MTYKSFSPLNGINSYLRATIHGPNGLNNLMLLNVWIYEEMTDKLNLCQVAKIFINNKPEHQSNVYDTSQKLNFPVNYCVLNFLLQIAPLPIIKPHPNCYNCQMW